MRKEGVLEGVQKFILGLTGLHAELKEVTATAMAGLPDWESPFKKLPHNIKSVC